MKFRGIEISIVSQFDIQRLPEYAHRASPMGAFDATSASCYTPTYPGSQIWFEYSIDGPHPPKAMYFFKLFFNDSHIISWDCTAQHDYHGKTCYCLHHARNQLAAHINAHALSTAVERHAFQFPQKEEDQQKSIDINNDCIEIKVYRIEHRQRVHKFFEMPKDLVEEGAGRLKLVKSGIMEPERPQRRYKYQLLDPIDMPYAKFRFFYRSYDWLEAHGLLNNAIVPVDESIDSSILWYDPNQIDMIESSPSGYGSPDYSHPWLTSSHQSPLGSPARKAVPSPLRTAHTVFPVVKPDVDISADPAKAQRDHENKQQMHPTGSNDSLSLVIKGSIEDLVSSVPRSPQSPRKQKSQLHRGRHTTGGIGQASAGRLKSSRDTSDATYDLFNNSESIPDENDDGNHGTVGAESSKRPLSPFTNGGFLRRLRTPTPTQMLGISEDECGKADNVHDKDGEEKSNKTEAQQSSKLMGSLRKMFVSQTH